MFPFVDLIGFIYLFILIVYPNITEPWVKLWWAHTTKMIQFCLLCDNKAIGESIFHTGLTRRGAIQWAQQGIMDLRWSLTRLHQRDCWGIGDCCRENHLGLVGCHRLKSVSKAPIKLQLKHLLNYSMNQNLIHVLHIYLIFVWCSTTNGRLVALLCHELTSLPITSTWLQTQMRHRQFGWFRWILVDLYWF